MLIFPNPLGDKVTRNCNVFAAVCIMFIYRFIYCFDVFNIHTKYIYLLLCRECYLFGSGLDIPNDLSGMLFLRLISMILTLRIVHLEAPNSSSSEQQPVGQPGHDHGGTGHYWNVTGIKLLNVCIVFLDVDKAYDILTNSKTV